MNEKPDSNYYEEVKRFLLDHAQKQLDVYGNNYKDDYQFDECPDGDFDDWQCEDKIDYDSYSSETLKFCPECGQLRAKKGGPREYYCTGCGFVFRMSLTEQADLCVQTLMSFVTWLEMIKINMSDQEEISGANRWINLLNIKIEEMEKSHGQ